MPGVLEAMHRAQKKSSDQQTEKHTIALAISKVIALTADQLQSAAASVAGETDGLLRATLATSFSDRRLLTKDASQVDVALRDLPELISEPSSEIAPRVQRLDRHDQGRSHVRNQLRLLSQRLDCQKLSGEAIGRGLTMGAEWQLFDDLNAPDRATAMTKNQRALASNPVVFQ